MTMTTEKAIDEMPVEELVAQMGTMDWKEFRYYCKYKFNTGGMNRQEMETKLRAMTPDPTIDSQEARIKTLESELSIAKSVEKSVLPPDRTLSPQGRRIEELEAQVAEYESGNAFAGQFGQAYHLMNNATLRSQCLARNVVNDDNSPAHGVSNRLEMIARLQHMDAQKGLKPRPASDPIKVQNAVPTTTLRSTSRNSASVEVQNCRFLIDQNENRCITVHQHGRNTPEGPTMLPMEDNVRRIMEIFNGVEE